MMYETLEEPISSNTEKETSIKDCPQPNPKKRKRNKHDYQHWLAEPYNTARGETALWVAVITQAMMDALSNSRNPEILVHKHEAIRWLTGGNKDFYTVCHFAGMDPDYVRKKAKLSIANPTQWRAEAGKGSRYAERKAYRKKINEQKSQKNIDNKTNAANIITGCWE